MGDFNLVTLMIKSLPFSNQRNLIQQLIVCPLLIFKLTYCILWHYFRMA